MINLLPRGFSGHGAAALWLVLLVPGAAMAQYPGGGYPGSGYPGSGYPGMSSSGYPGSVGNRYPGYPGSGQPTSDAGAAGATEGPAWFMLFRSNLPPPGLADGADLESAICFLPSASTQPTEPPASKGAVLFSDIMDGDRQKVSGTGGVPLTGEAVMPPGYNLFAFTPLPVTALPGEDTPDSNHRVILGLSAGIGGHHLVDEGSTFPIRLKVKTPFHGWASANRTSHTGLTWSVRIDSDNEGAEVVEMDPTAASDGGMQSWDVALKVEGPEGTLRCDSGSFVIDVSSWKDVAYWVTPQVNGIDSRDKVLTLAAGPTNGNIARKLPTWPPQTVTGTVALPGYPGVSMGYPGVSTTSSQPAVSALPNPARLAGAPYSPHVRRLDVVSPNLAPETVQGWAQAKVVVIDHAGEQSLSPKAKAALLQWVSGGGRLGVFPGSTLAPKGTTGTMTCGRGQIVAAPAGMVDLIGAYRSITLLPGEMPVATPEFVKWALGLANQSTFYWFRDQPAPIAEKPRIRLPHWSTFVLIGLGYTLLFGPFSLWAMRRVRRILHVWMVVPVIAGALTVAVLFFGRGVIHALRSVNAASVVVAQSGASEGIAVTNLVCFTPEPGGFDLRAGGQSLTGTAPPDQRETPMAGAAAPTDTTNGTLKDVFYDGEHHAQVTGLPGYGETDLNLSGTVSLHGSLQIQLNVDGGGTLANHTDRMIPAAFITVPRYAMQTPALAPGASFHFSRGDWDGKRAIGVASAGSCACWHVNDAPFGEIGVDGPATEKQSCQLNVIAEAPESLKDPMNVR